MSRTKLFAYQREVIADDGYPLATYELRERLSPPGEPPRAWMFYLVGSEPQSIIASKEAFAGLVATGLVVVLLQPRGVAQDGGVDQSVFWQYDTKQRRVADQRVVVSSYLGEGPSAVPVLLTGASEGGDIAAAVAARDSRVTHVMMLATGGGWVQSEEMRFFVRKNGAYLGISSLEELEAKFDEIRERPDSGEMWMGHPFRHWSSYLWVRALEDLDSSRALIFLAHGTADERVPVESARAVRDHFDRRAKTNLSYFEFPGLDHAFADPGTHESHLPAVQRDALAWLAKSGLADLSGAGVP
jgi:Prolyl oligopeptidase family